MKPRENDVEALHKGDERLREQDDLYRNAAKQYMDRVYGKGKAGQSQPSPNDDDTSDEAKAVKQYLDAQYGQRSQP